MVPCDAGPGRLRMAGERVARELALDCALSEVVQEFDRRGIDSLLLKGPALARWLYDDVVERPYGDIDLLVAFDRFPDAQACLAEQGFAHESPRAPLEREPHHETWMRSAGVPAVIELHHSMFFLPADPEAVWAGLSRDAETIRIAGVPVRVPSPPARALIVALHAAQHGRHADRTLRDLELALERADLETWSQAAELASALASLPALSAGLRLSPRGRALCQTLGIPPPADRVVRLFAETPPRTAYGIERLITTPGLRARLALLASELFPSRDYLLASSRLAPLGPLGLLLARLLRPLQLLVRLPAATASWLRAARPPGPARR